MPHLALSWFLSSSFGGIMTALKILVVDDSRTIRTHLQKLLCDAGYEVALAADGDEGFRLVAAERPDLLILDIQMPGMDGYTLCESVKQMDKPWCSLPIIFVTSLESNALSLLGNQMGAYLKKPLCREAVLEAVGGVLEPLASE